MKLSFTGWSDISAKVDDQKIKSGLIGVAEAVKKEFKNDMSKPKSGKTYVLNGKLHRASAPGETPAVFTGALRRGVGSYVTPTSVVIGTHAVGEYVKYLADGSPRHRIRKRAMTPEAYMRVGDKRAFFRNHSGLFVK